MRVGLLVGEMQILHLMHSYLTMTSVANSDLSIVALGSADKYGVLGHPFTFAQRKKMVEIIFGDRVQVISLADIDSSVDDEVWMAYVLKKISEAGLPEPTDYYSGSKVDAKYYSSFFPSADGTPVICGPISTYTDQDSDRRLHIIDRHAFNFMQARELRFLVETRDDSWKPYVPARLWDFIEWEYPPHLRSPVNARSLPNEKSFPTGTRLVLEKDPNQVFILKDDGAWRVARKETDEKAEAARKMHELRNKSK